MALTLLSVLDVAGCPKYCDGETIPVKDYANLWVSSNTDTGIEVLQGPETIATSTGGNSYFFTGLKPKISYTVRISNEDELLEQVVHLDVDRAISFGTSTFYVDDTMWDGGNWRKVIASILILLVITGGMMVIYRIEH